MHRKESRAARRVAAVSYTHLDVYKRQAYHCWCSAERLTAMREHQQKLKQPTGYDRMCLGKTQEERAALPGYLSLIHI